MKKRCIAALFVLLGTQLFALQETWTSYGFGLGNYFDRTEGADSYTPMPGFLFGGYGFEDRRNVGFFSQLGVLHQASKSEDWDTTVFLDCSFGPGFRFMMNDDMGLHFGVGISGLLEVSGVTKDGIDYSRMKTALGMAVDLGLKIDLSNRFYLDFGVTGSYFFLARESRWKSEQTGEKSYTQTDLFDGEVPNYLVFGVRPYLCVGFNYYAEQPVPGKPPR